MKSSSYYYRKAENSRELGRWEVAKEWQRLATKARKLEAKRKGGAK